MADLLGGMTSWQQGGLPVRTFKNAPLPLMRQGQLTAGSLVPIGAVLSQLVAPGWIWLSGFVGMDRLLGATPWTGSACEHCLARRGLPTIKSGEGGFAALLVGSALLSGGEAFRRQAPRLGLANPATQQAENTDAQE